MPCDNYAKRVYQECYSSWNIYAVFKTVYISKNSFEQNTRTCTEPRSNFGEGDRFIEIGDEKFKYPTLFLV